MKNIYRMLYLLLTEAAEGMWAVARITWNGGVGVYNWYYDETPDNKVTPEEEREKIEIADLKKRIDQLEILLLEDKK
jgi:hypothetical protein